MRTCSHWCGTALSLDNKLFAIPFYAESSFRLTARTRREGRHDTPGDQPTWAQSQEWAAKLNDPATRSTAPVSAEAWLGENMAIVGSLAKTFGARYFDETWKLDLLSPEWKKAVTFYVDLMTKHGLPGAATNGHLENRTLFAAGNCATRG